MRVFDARAGRVVQEVDLGEWTGHCEIGDADDEGLVIRLEDRRIAYFNHQS